MVHRRTRLSIRGRNAGPQIAGGDAEALAEQSREMYRVLEAAIIGNAANLLLPGVITGEQSVGALKAQFAHIIGHGLAVRGEHAIQMSAGTVELPSDQIRAQMARRQVSPDEHLRRSE